MYYHDTRSQTDFLISIAVRRPCALMLHGLLRVFQVLRRPGRVLTITVDSYICINIWFVKYHSRCDAHARLIAAWATPGFSGAPPSGPRSHPRGQARLRLRLRQASTASQALSNAALAGARSLPGRLRTPRTRMGVLRGHRPEKPSADRESSKGNAYRDWYWIDASAIMVWVVFTTSGKGSIGFSAEGGGFFRLAPSTRQRARGVEVAGVKNAALRARFSGLAKETLRAIARSVDEGASPTPDTGAP